MTGFVASESEEAVSAVDAFESAVASEIVASAFAVPVTVSELEPVPELAVETATASIPSDLDYQDCWDSQQTNLPQQALAGE
ncbi:hypothetical protein BGZ90_008858 [Linnemannia elongata]|nr:hypothetical protein BGZ90_008858 [Linnemannia elongata]